MKMKNIATKIIAVLKTDLLRSYKSIFQNSIAVKTISLTLITALLMPIILLGDWQKATAQINTATSQTNLTAPVSASPQAFVVSSFDSVSSKAFGLAASFNTSVISSYGAVAGFVTAPTLPEGFEMAQPVSPLYASVASMGNYLGTFLGFSNPSSAATSPLTTQTASNNTEYDFDGDSKSDVARWKPSTGEWQIKSSNGGSLATSMLGTSASVLAPGDFDGDLKTDTAVFNSGTWTIKPSNTGTPYTISWGTTGDIPVTGDYNGDGRSDYAIYRPSTSTFWIQLSSDLSFTSTAFGASGDIPVPGDYDGDNKTDIAVFRPSDGNWYIKQSSTGTTVNPHWGVATDIPVPADYDGDGITDLSIYRPSSGTWFIYKSSGGGSYIEQIWGNYGDQPVPADYDGDGKADLSVWRPKTGVWFTYKSCNFTSTCGANPQYIYETLGTNGDVPVESSYIKKIGGLVQDYDLAKLRLSPKNATGGTDLYSRNFSWGTGLVGLPGRAGLDAGFGISYNSLVWLKDTTNNVMIFDPDQSNVTPGFNMGFPTIEPAYYDKNTKKFSYLMVTPSGARVEFQQTAASGIYETVDSSYVQLQTQEEGGINNPETEIAITVTGTDGTQMKYEWKAGAFRCKEIKDRNGNFITIVHDQYGLLRTVTDTLGRVITVNYDAEFYPTSITQEWRTNNGEGSATTHTWASFAYTNKTISTNFASGHSVFGPSNGTSIKVLQKITYPDNSYTTFEYNGYGQVSKVNNHAADWHLLNYVKTNLETPAANQTDCPRFTETRNWVENFNNNAEVVITNEIATGHQISDLDGNTVTASRIQVALQNHPNGNITNMYVGESGWMEGLPILVDDYANGNGLELKRSNWTKWTQDDPNLTYINNPRVVATKVGDNVSSKLTEIDYKLLPLTTIAEYGLVEEVRLYDGSNTLLKKSATTYNLDNAYVSRRIIGLPSQSESFGFDQGTNQLSLVSKITYNYDEGNFSDSGLEQNIASVISHDNTNYSSNFIAGRGNLTSSTRWNADYPTSSSEAITSSVKYNIAGAVVAQSDPMNRTVKISYADKFNETPTSRNTYAYATKITDPAGNYSDVKYRFDLGANVWAKSPAPAGNINGKETVKEYDSIGRLSKNKIENSGAYIRYEYPTNGVQSKVFSTIVDTNNNGAADLADEVYAESWVDGAGRVLRSRSEHPGSTGGWKGNLTEYDILGRAIRSTVPTEISVSGSTWNPAGDDNRGLDINNNPVWLWEHAEYDWKSRVTREINTDGTDRLYNYNGCGCAGGQLRTIQSELVPREDQSSVNARRTQKIYEDVLGRTEKIEEMNWEGTLPSRTTVKTFNGRDQITKTREYAGTEGNSLFQDSTTIYDGFGRVWKTHYPEQQNTDNTPAYTTTLYNQDSSIQSVTDARGTTDSYTYNNLGLLTQITYVSPAGSTIAATPTTTFSYDVVGNRTQMIDASGTTSYQYNELSQIISETKQFSGLLDSFTLDYEYQFNGSVKKISISPNNTSVSYNYDKSGRVSSVHSEGFFNSYGVNPPVQISSIVDNINYRAWDKVKSINYSNSRNLTINYDNNLSVSSFQLPDFIEINYQYNKDGRVKFADYLQDEKFDRSYTYDNLQRLVSAKTGEQANGGSAMTGPYNQSFGYDNFNNSISRNTAHWSANYAFQSTYNNNRRTGWQYDETGNVVVFDEIINNYDAAGNKTKIVHPVQIEGDPSFDHTRSYSEKFQTYDGDGQIAIEKIVKNDYRHIGTLVSHRYNGEIQEYNLKSTVLGGAILFKLETNYQWRYPNTYSTYSQNKTNVFLHGKLLAVQTIQSSGYNYFHWKHTDPMATTVGWTNLDSEGIEGVLDPTGADVGLYDPYEDPNPPTPEPPFRTEYASPEPIEMIEVDGVLTPMSLFPGLASIVSQCPRNGCGPIRTENGFEWWTAFADGYEGYLPMGGHYAGGGEWSWQDDKTRKQNNKRPTFSPKQKKPKDLPDIDPRTEAPVFDVEGIRQGIRNIWANPDCRNVVLGLLNVVTNKSNPLVKEGDIGELFELLLRQRKGGLTRERVPGSAGGGSVTGSFGNGNASVSAPANSPDTPQLQLKSDIGYVFNELMHLAGRNRIIFDQEFAEKIKTNPIWASAAKKITLESSPNYETLIYPLDIPGLTSEKRELLKNPGDTKWSEYFHTVIEYNCFR